VIFSAFFGVGTCWIKNFPQKKLKAVLVLAGTTLAFQGVLNYLTDAYVVYSASVLASNDFMRAAFGAGAPLFARRYRPRLRQWSLLTLFLLFPSILDGLFVNLGIAWGDTLLGLISVLFIPLPFLLYKFGHIARKKSDKAQS
jgi:DHA1 family multidrug resistance protein-like MFS transporter